jgi:uncharacterized protein (TIGR02118 family)
MFRTTFLLKRLEGDSKESFEHRWLNDHLPMVEKIPGIDHIIKSRVVTVGGPAADFDAITEIVWDNEAAFREALLSPEGQACVADIASFTSAHDYVVVERA